MPNSTELHTGLHSDQVLPRPSREYLYYHRICPVRYREDGQLVVAAAPDARREALDELAAAHAVVIAVEEIAGDELERMIERFASIGDREDARAETDTDAEELTADARELANQPPAISYVNLIIGDAYNARASDIHLEADRTGLTARFRIDGVLVPAPEPPAGLHAAVVSRLKLLAQLDIAERRRPQDGRIRVRLVDRELDLRVSTVPTMYGESVVLRLLDRGGRPVALEELGMPSDVLAAVDRLAQRPHGMLLVTGPTGSGKTTTLYAALTRRDVTREKIVTVEDPIEYHLPGVTQVPVHRQSGVTFAAALRSILRQDPDVIMIGEMRDPETAEIAVQSAMTGHLVFSTLHTNDALAAFPRLADLGVAGYLIAATVEGILAQRLVRRICDGCRADYEPDHQRLSALAGRPIGRVRLQRGVGCAACRGTGYRGRTGIYELVLVADELRDAIVHGANRSELQEIAGAAGWPTLRTDGLAKIEAGLTTLEEVLRVVQ